MMLCVACGQENREGAKFCKNCGARLTLPPPDAPTVTVTSTDLAAPSPIEQQPSTPVTEPPVIIPAPAPDGKMKLDQAPTTVVAVAELDSPQARVGPESEVSAPLLDTALTATPVVKRPAAKRRASADKRKRKKRSNPALAEQAPQGKSADNAAQKAVAIAHHPALANGTVIADRYWVIGHRVQATGAISYEAEDHGVCRACGVVATATAEEQYCYDCGAHLLDTTLPWPTLRLRQLPDGADIGGASPTPLLSWQTYHFAKEPDTNGAAPTPSFTRGVHLLVGQHSDVGAMRTDRPDEDSIFTLTLSSLYESQAQSTLGLYLVADGMGGHGDGEIASRIAVETISVTLLQSLILPTLQFGAPAPESITRQIEEAIQLANRQIGEQAQARKNEMGTTITLAFVVNDLAYIANVGDSRTYHWHSQGLTQVTEDHSAVYQLLKRGLLTGDEIYRHPRRNEILRSLGIAAPVKVDHFQVRLAPGNLLLLCCDGLWEMTRNEGIEEVLLQGFPDPQVICDELIRRANQAGGEDNISVIAVRILA